MNRFGFLKTLTLLSLAVLSACAHTAGKGPAAAGVPIGNAPADAIENDAILRAFDPSTEEEPRQEETAKPEPETGAPETEMDDRQELDQKAEKEDLLLSTIDPPESPADAADPQSGAGPGAGVAPGSDRDGEAVIREDPILSALDSRHQSDAPGDAKAERARKKAENKAEKKARKAKKKAERDEMKHRKKTKDEQDEEKEDRGYEDDIQG